MKSLTFGGIGRDHSFGGGGGGVSRGTAAEESLLNERLILAIEQIC